MYTLKFTLKDSNEKESTVNINSKTYSDDEISAFTKAYRRFTTDTVTKVQKRGDFEDVTLD